MSGASRAVDRADGRRLSQHRSKLSRAAHSIAQLADSCFALVDASERETSAALAAAVRSRDRLRAQHDEARRDVEARRARLDTARQQLDRRKANLARARAALPSSASIEAECATLDGRCLAVERSVAAERQRLVADAMAVFAVPADGASITGLPLPHSDQLRRNQTLEASAATLHTALLIRLLALYLDVRLPFAIVAGPKPTIRAGSASAWTGKWSTPAQPLDLSPREKDRPSSGAKEGSGTTSVTGFVTGLAMLAYDAAFIAHALGLAINAGTSHRTLQTLARLATAPSFDPKCVDDQRPS